MSSKRPPISPQAVLLVGILAASTASILIRFAQDEAPSIVIATYRLVFAAVILAPFALITRKKELLGLERRTVLFGLLSGTFLALHFATWITSLEYTSVTSSVVLVSTTPLWVAILAPFTIKEPITRLMTIGMLLALAGGIVIGFSDACSISAAGIDCPGRVEFLKTGALAGDLLALIGAIMAACYLLVGRQLRHRLSNTSYIFLVYSMAGIVLTLITLISGNQLLGYPARTYIWFLLLAIIPQLIGHSAFNWALGYLSAGYVSISLLGEPIGSSILAFLMLDETPTLINIFGAILILAGIYIAARGERVQKPEAFNPQKARPD